MKFSTSVSMLSLVSLLASCSQQEYILPGERETLRSLNPQTLGEAELTRAKNASNAEVQPDSARAIRLPAMKNYTSWTQRGGSVQHQVVHPALSKTPKLLFSADIGQGNDRKHRITAEPVVANGLVFTLDSRAQVVATATNGVNMGQALWVRDLTPADDHMDDASGGGLAYDQSTLFVTSAFGTLSALNAATGELKWEQDLPGVGAGAPLVSQGIVYVISRDNSALAIDVHTGRVKWQLSATPSQDGIVGASAPAISGENVILPFASGELIAALKKGGARRWSTSISGVRAGRGYSKITDITGEPVVKDGVIYAGNPAGRTMAINSSGERIWTAVEGSMNSVWVTGGSVFLISDEGQLVRLDATNGTRIWGVDLPYYVKEKPRKLKAITASYGPILAGELLWIASSDGVMRGFDPKDGAQITQVEIPGGAATRPVVVNHTAYIVSGEGQLLALR